MNENYFLFPYGNELYHIGIKGRSGRYPYGSGERPYQDKERARPRTFFERRKEQKIQKQKNAEAKMKQEAAEAQKKHEEDKERVLKSGTATEIMKYKGELTNKEMELAYNRLDWEAKLSSFAAKEIRTNMQKIDDIMNDVKTITNWGNIGVNSYNLMARVYNATEEGKKNPWPVIAGPGGGNSGGKKKKR